METFITGWWSFWNSATLGTFIAASIFIVAFFAAWVVFWAAMSYLTNGACDEDIDSLDHLYY